MHIAIIGNGISGVSCARHIRKLSDHRITIISSETEHFFSRTALMYIYMGHMQYKDIKPYEDFFWEKNRIDLKFDHVEKVDFENYKLECASGDEVVYDKLVLATGSQPNKFGWEGQDLPGVQGLYSWQDLESMEKHTQNCEKAVVIGGGLIGIEMAEMLHSRHINTSLLVRESSFWNNVLPAEESAMVNRHIVEHGIDLHLNTELDRINGRKESGVKGVKTKNGREFEAQFVGLTVGVHPNIEFLKDSNLETNKGILVNRHLETNMKDVFAIGDCAEFRESIGNRKSIEQVWYTGKIMGETLAYTLCGKPTEYRPGVWFNSAKFFDIEYQTYGWVFPEPKENETHFYWEHENMKQGIRLNFNSESLALIGVNAMGVRLRHEVLDQWIKKAKPVNEVVRDFHTANFNPEFFEKFENKMIEAFNSQFPEMKIQKKKKKKFFGLIG